MGGDSTLIVLSDKAKTVIEMTANLNKKNNKTSASVRWFKFLQGLTVAEAKCTLTYMCSDMQEKGPQALNKVRPWIPLIRSPHLKHLPRCLSSFHSSLLLNLPHFPDVFLL